MNRVVLAPLWGGTGWFIWKGWPNTTAWGLNAAMVATTPASFGSLNSTQVRNVVQSASTSNAGLQCTGSLLNLLASDDHFFATFTPVGGTSGLVGPTGDVIAYTLYANTTTSFAINRNQRFDFARNGIIDALGLLNGTSPKSVPVYLKSLIGSNVAAGLYQESFVVEWDINYCYGIGLLGACLGRQILKQSTSLTINLTVTNDCQITTPAIIFGSALMISDFTTVNQSINLSCTKGSNYTVGLDDGQNAAGGRRRMKSSAKTTWSMTFSKAPVRSAEAWFPASGAPVVTPTSIRGWVPEPVVRFSTTTPRFTPIRPHRRMASTWTV